MRGRVISDAPSRNAHGVPFRTLYLREKSLSERLFARYRDALQAWLDADELPPNSRKRWELLKLARVLTQRALS